MNETDTLLSQILASFSLKEKEVNQYSPLTLAYLGDVVYEIIIRTIVVESKPGNVNSLHKRTSSLVNAKAQADIIANIESILTEEEFTIYKRGRNSKPHSIAKNAALHDYKSATGFEALMGYLFLDGRMNRCLELVKLGLPDLSERM